MPTAQDVERANPRGKSSDCGSHALSWINVKSYLVQGLWCTSRAETPPNPAACYRVSEACASDCRGTSVQAGTIKFTLHWSTPACSSSQPSSHGPPSQKPKARDSEIPRQSRPCEQGYIGHLPVRRYRLRQRCPTRRWRPPRLQIRLPSAMPQSNTRRGLGKEIH